MKTPLSRKIIAPVLGVLLVICLLVLLLSQNIFRRAIDYHHEQLYGDQLHILLNILQKKAVASSDNAVTQQQAIKELAYIYSHNRLRDGYPVIFDKNGQVIMHPAWTSDSSPVTLTVPVEKLAKQTDSPLPACTAGTNTKSICAYFSPWQWVVTWVAPDNHGHVVVGRMLNGLSLVLLSTIVFILAALSLLLVHILKPVKTLTRASRAMAEGNLDIPVTVNSNDELAELANSFTAMRESVRQQLQQLHNRESLYRELVESANSIILRWDRKGNILFMNQYGLDLFGFTARELFGRNAIGTIIADHDSNGRSLAAMIEDIVEHPEKYLLNKNENICKDGSTVWIQWSNQPIKDEQGQFNEILSVGIDVTPLELARQQLRDNEIRFQTLFETSHDAILIIQDGVITCCNRQAEEMFGCSRQEIVGKTPLSFSCTDQPGGRNIEDLHREHLERIQTEERLCFDWRFKRKNGEEREAEVNLNSITIGNMNSIQASVHDKTERLKLEQELRQHQKMEAIGTLAGGIAHDFNNILTAIMGFTEIALNKLEDKSPVTDELRQIDTASRRARDLIRQILTFSRKSPRSKQPIQISLVIREVARLLRSSIPSTIEIRQQLDSESFVNADPTQIHQVVMNLCTNAFHAMEQEGGQLTIALDDVEGSEINSNSPHLVPGGYISLRIEDTGKGIAPEIISKIFDPYFTTKEQAKGSGMGLAVVHGIVESHGGSIMVDSKPGRGSTFTVYLPKTTPAKNVNDNKPAKLSGIDAARGRRIMFVDDEAVLRDLTSDFLVSRGYDVHSFMDGRQAWEAFIGAPEDWDLIITDQTMPHLTGFELIKKIRTYPSRIPILLCTGYNECFSPDEMKQLGINGILQKPSSLQRLLTSVQAALGSCNYPKS